MEQGPHEKKIIQEAMRAGLPIPARIQNAPELKPELTLFLQAYNDLSTCRVDKSIPWTAVDQWCRSHDIDGEQREEVLYFVNYLNSWFVTWRSSKSKGTNNAHVPAGKSKNVRVVQKGGQKR